jgi:hypothetical protein
MGDKACRDGSRLADLQGELGTVEEDAVVIQDVAAEQNPRFAWIGYDFHRLGWQIVIGQQDREERQGVYDAARAADRYVPDLGQAQRPGQVFREYGAVRTRVDLGRNVASLRGAGWVS